MGHDQAGTDRVPHEQARARRWTGARLERGDDLRACVLERLSWGWSPEQIAGHLAEAAGRTVISYESICRFIYAQAARHKNCTPGWRAICHGRSGSAADGGAREAVRPPSSRTADRSPNPRGGGLTARLAFGGEGGGYDALFQGGSRGGGGLHERPSRLGSWRGF